MAGVCVSGVMWAIFQNNAGGAWDNAKKSFEAGVEINGEMTYKGSDAHKAAVTGDTVGDPFKDTSGPSMNILIKLTCLVGLVIAPILGGHAADSDENIEEHAVEVIEEGEAAVNELEAAKSLDADGNYVYNVGELTELTLPGGQVLKVGANSSENKLFQLLSDNNYPVEGEGDLQWITLDRTYFKTGSNELTEKSEQQIKNVAALMAAFPDAKLKLGGYTDNTGSPEGNLNLSQKRAESVKTKLEHLKVTADRTTAKGYGEEHPICPTNDTDACKAQNRRVDVALVK